MLRLTLCCLLMGTLAQVAPPGCPPVEDTPEPFPSERGTLETTATASAEVATVETVITLAAAVTAPPAGEIGYGWLQISGPGVRIVNANTSEASFTTPSLALDATLVFRVTTRSADGLSVGFADAQVVVTADPNFGEESDEGGSTGDSNQAPLAHAGADQQVEEGQRVTLDGSSSRGSNLTYRWRQPRGPMVLLSATDTARITFNTPAYDATSDNELEFELQVTDGSGRFATDRVVITVTEASGAADGGDSSLPRVKVRTSLGDFVVELDQENAPITVANFLEYVNDRFYDGTIFHRVIPAFVVQGGGFTPGMVRKDTRDPIVNEASNGLKNDRGTIAMARTNDPDSATSQFYVNLVDNDSLNASGSSGGYAVFGKVVSGMDVVDLIATVETTSKAGANDVPVDDVKILGVTLIETEGDSPV